MLRCLTFVRFQLKDWFTPTPAVPEYFTTMTVRPAMAQPDRLVNCFEIDNKQSISFWRLLRVCVVFQLCCSRAIRLHDWFCCIARRTGQPSSWLALRAAANCQDHFLLPSSLRFPAEQAGYTQTRLCSAAVDAAQGDSLLRRGEHLSAQACQDIHSACDIRFHTRLQIHKQFVSPI